jgi:hypothetical protein
MTRRALSISPYQKEDPELYIKTLKALGLRIKKASNRYGGTINT